jgi:hypothetical protein
MLRSLADQVGGNQLLPKGAAESGGTDQSVLPVSSAGSMEQAVDRMQFSIRRWDITASKVGADGDPLVHAQVLSLLTM